MIVMCGSLFSESVRLYVAEACVTHGGLSQHASHDGGGVIVPTYVHVNPPFGEEYIGSVRWLGLQMT